MCDYAELLYFVDEIGFECEQIYFESSYLQAQKRESVEM